MHGKTPLWKQFFAIANPEMPSQKLHDLLRSTRIWERTPSMGFLRWMTRVHDARELLVRQHKIRIRFVILEHGVESRFMFTNELAFEDQCFLRCRRNDALDIVCSSDQFGNHVSIRIGRKIRANPLIQTRCFTDVQHSTFSRFEQIDAR